MGFSKIRYDSGEEVFITEVQEGNKTIERWKVNKKDYVKVLRNLNNKYGLNLIIKEKRQDTDLDWALQ